MKNPWDVVSGFKHDNGLKCHWGKESVTVDVSSGSKCHSERNMGGRNVKAPFKVTLPHHQEIMETPVPAMWDPSLELRSIL